MRHSIDSDTFGKGKYICVYICLTGDLIFIIDDRFSKRYLVSKALGSDSVTLEPLVVNVVALSCDINQEGHVYLLDDGLELWLALLENSPAPTPGISGLFRNMPPLLGKRPNKFDSREKYSRILLKDVTPLTLSIFRSIGG